MGGGGLPVLHGKVRKKHLSGRNPNRCFSCYLQVLFQKLLHGSGSLFLPLPFHRDGDLVALLDGQAHQLHQLRGRVGRGKYQSYCIMVNCGDEEGTSKRLDILNRSNDGFYIASEDLKLRGPGDIFGLRQSGDMEFRLADIFTDASVLKTASEEVNRLLADDPGLAKEDHEELMKRLDSYLERSYEKLNL